MTNYNYGEKVISTKRLTTEIAETEGRYELYTRVQQATFVFERPDTKKLILEVEGNLIEESAENVFPYGEGAYLALTEEISNQYNTLISSIEKELTDILESLKVKVKEKSLTSYQIERLNEILEKEENENKRKSLNQLNKHLQRLNKRITSISENIAEKQKKLTTHKNAEQCSLEELKHLLA